MRIRWLSLLLTGAVCSATAQGAEPYLEFLSGLRQRGYFDYAQLYLDQLAQRPGVPEEIRQIVPFEKAVTLLESVRAIHNPQESARQLDEALALLDRFVTANPNHALAGRANSERARILLGRARVEVWQSRSPANKNNRAEFQQRARGFIGTARTIFQTAHDQYQKTWESFPRYLDKQQDKQRFDARAKAEVAFIRTQLDLAKCTYEEAQTFDAGSANFKELLTKASKAFEAIHARYRSQVGGLYAKMWQGKCFEEQHDTQKALGIYIELLGHPGRSETMRRLQNDVARFRLVCLNHDNRRDYQLVIDEGQEWIKNNRSGLRTEAGLGIRWEMARAQESLAEQRGAPKEDRERLLRRALENVQYVNRYSAELKDIAMFKARELQVRLKGKAADPRDFDTAFGLASEMVSKGIKRHQDAVAAAQSEGKPSDEIAKLEQDHHNHLLDTAAMLNRALEVADARTDTDALKRARYFLAYVNLLLKRSYEAAILGEFVAKHSGHDDAQLGLDAAYLAMAAYNQALNDIPQGPNRPALRTAVQRQIVRIGELITSRWPNSEKAHTAYLEIGRIFRHFGEPARAAEFYTRVPESSKQYGRAQLSAGQANLQAYYEAVRQPDDKRPQAQLMTGWQSAAEQHLRTGLARRLKDVPASVTDPEEISDILAGKLSLAQIVITQGHYQQAIDLLTQETHAVVKAVAVKDETARPKAPHFQSREFAADTHQCRLRAYVGLRQLDQARAAMQDLEAVIGAASSEAVTAIYVKLGEELQRELKALKSTGDTNRLKEVTQSFEQFLGDMFGRKEQTYGSLIWIAETYFGLGEGGEAGQSQTYFDRAASTYQTILERAASDPKFSDSSRLTGVKLRLVNCRRRQRQFETALRLVAEILAANPKILDAQIEAASVLQDWGASGQHDKFLTAIKGQQVDAAGQKAPLWGWGQIALRLQRLIDAKSSEADKYREKYYHARFNSAECRRLFATHDGQMNNTELRRARQEILAFASVSRQIPDAWWDRFDRLYRQVQTDLGEKKPIALEPPKTVEPTNQVAQTSPTAAASGQPEPASVLPTAEPLAAGGFGWSMLALVVVCLGGSAWGIVAIVRSRKTRRRVTYAASTAPLLPPQRSASDRQRPSRPPAAAPARHKKSAPPKPKPPQARSS